MTVRLEDIAKKSGFSVPTVSRVLTNSDYPVSERARNKILAVAQEMGYRPNLSARSLRTERTNTIGIVIDDLLSPFTPPIIRGIQDFLTEHDYLSLIVNTDFNPELEQGAVDNLLSRPVDGIIFVEFTHLADIDDLIQTRKPYVFVHRLFGRQVCNSIVPDDFYNARLVVEHLIRLGHRRIGYIHGPAHWHSAQGRLDAYRDVLQQHGIPMEDSLVQPGNWEQASGYTAAQQFLSLAERPTAIFAANDLMALGAVYALQDAGLRVPGDVAIAGYDNRDFTIICRPQLTTVNMPVYEMGWIAGEMAIRQINQGLHEEEEIKVKGKLYVRESCGADASLRTVEEPRDHVNSRRILLNVQPEG